MKHFFKSLSVAALALFAAACSQNNVEDLHDGLPGDIRVNFTLALPSGGDVVYPSRTLTHDSAEWDIKNLDLYQFNVAEDGQVTFLEKKRFAENDIKNLSAGQYSLAFTIPAEFYMQTRRFVFVANDKLETTPDAAAITKGMTYDAFCKTLASITNAEGGAKSEMLAQEANGIAMSGIAKIGNVEDIVLKSSFECHISLTRIVARVDVVNNTPNMIIDKIYMKQAAQKAFIMPQGTETPNYDAPEKAYMSGNLDFNTNAKNGSGTPGYGTTYDEQYNGGAGIQKSIYMYERKNESAENTASVVVEYKINGVHGMVEVPFKNTESQKFVDIKRNNLYKIVLGNGNPVATDKVMVAFNDEPWNIIENESQVDVEQDKMNAKLKVNMFTPYNVKTADLTSGVVTFETETTCEAARGSFFSFDQLEEKLYAGVPAPAVFHADGQNYRLPSAGETMLLAPSVEGTHPLNNATISSDVFTETIYWKNGFNGKADLNGEKLVGTSQLKAGSNKVLNGTTFTTVYGYRFRGTNEHAAYRWDFNETQNTGRQESDKMISIRIKALHPDDTATTIEEIADEKFWENGYIEFEFPMSGDYLPKEQFERRGIAGHALSSTRESDTRAKYFVGWTQGIYVDKNTSDISFPLRLVKATQEDVTAHENYKKHLQAVEESMKNVAVGDFILDDGLVVKASEMAGKDAATKKKAVAVVFSVDKTRVGDEAKKKLGGEAKVHGRALALKDAGRALAWGSENTATGVLTAMDTYVTIYKDIDGYSNTQKIYELGKGNLATKFPVFNAIKNFDSKQNAPSNTTGWYLPTMGEWYDVIEGIGGATIKEDHKTNTETVSSFTIQDNDGQNINGMNVANTITAAISAVDAGNYDAFDANGDNIIRYYWSSTECLISGTKPQVRYLDFLNNNCIGNFYTNMGSSHTHFRIRGVFAF